MSAFLFRVFISMFLLQKIILADMSECEKISVSLLSHIGSDKLITSIQPIIHDIQEVGCVSHLNDGGYILISNATNASPIRMYSLFGSFSAMQDDVKNMLIDDLIFLKLHETDEIHPSRRYLLGLQGKSLKKLYAAVEQLPLQTKWNQDGLYQLYMPKIDGQSTLVGCVNVALGQIMRYHKHPQKGKGAVYSTFNGQVLRAVTNREYNWEEMPAKLDSSAQEYQIDAVAMLLYDLAIANQTTFGVNGSGASLLIDRLYKNFGYSKDIATLEANDKTLFFETIKSEIDKKRPLFLTLPSVTSGSTGHAVVIDGYQENGDGKFMHINFGWAGAFDGYINLDSDVSIEGLSLSSAQMQIYYNIKPCSQDAKDCYDINSTLEENDFLSSDALSGKIDFEKDEDIFEITLSKDTTFTFSNTSGLYLNLFDNTGKFIVADKTTFHHTLTTGKYQILISQRSYQVGENNSYSYYPFSGVKSYAIHMSTTSPSVFEILTLQSSPIIFDNLKSIVLKKGESKKILINAATTDDDTKTLAIFGDSNIISVSNEGNIYTVNAKNVGITNLKIKAFANNKESEKSISLVVIDDAISIGKNAILKEKFLESDTRKIFTFKTMLDGNCRIKGDRGFDNTAFFIGVNTTPSIEDPILASYQRGIYTIQASLHSGNSYYDIKNHSDFTISVDCDGIQTSPEYLANAFGFEGFTLEKTKSVAIKNGWNLVALASNDAISVANFFAHYPKAKMIWQYQDGKWYAYAKDAEIINKIATNAIPFSKYISSESGFWVYADEDFELTSEGDMVENSLIPKSSTWNLIGIQKETTPSSILSQNVKMMWRYSTNGWSGYSNESATNTLLQEKYSLVQTIPAGSGLWVLVQ